jgi:integrase
VKNVASVEKPPRVERENEIQIVEEHRLQELLKKLKGQAIYPKVVLAVFTGLRRGELLALRWRHIDLDRKMLEVREALQQTTAHGIQVKAPKSKAGRRDVTLPEIVVEALREHRRAQLELRMRLGLGRLSDDDGLVFPAPAGGPMSPHALTMEWSHTADSVGMADITFHALRHTHASHLIDAGRLGHSSPNVTLGTYAHFFRQQDDKAATAINNALAKW